MAKLNQIIAVEKGIKSSAYSAVGQLHKVAQKSALFNGFAKQYTPINEDGETLPPEHQRVQFTAREALRNLEQLTAPLLNITARKDYTNCLAKADVVVEGTAIAKDVPVSYLLFLEKQLLDLRTFANDLPVLDSAEDWTFDVNSGVYKTATIKTQRSKKTQRPIVLYDATEHHPAQTQLITEDILAGYWNQVKQSGAMPAPEKAQLLKRIEKLIVAVKQARESANGADEVEVEDIGSNVFNFLLKE